MMKPYSSQKLLCRISRYLCISVVTLSAAACSSGSSEGKSDGPEQNSALLEVTPSENELSDDLEPQSSSYFYRPSFRVSSKSLYRVTVTNLTETQPMTPPVVASHSRFVALFRTELPAPRGVREIAENGNLDPLTEALERSRLVSDFAVGVAGDPPPLMPGASVTVEVEADRFRRRLSMASMLICSNDGFTGLDSVKLPRRVGETVSYTTRGYDAGSEINTEDFADIVPPCQALRGVSSEDAGTGESNPELAEGDVVRLHPGIDGSLPTSDLTVADHGFEQPVARVEITRIAKYEVSPREPQLRPAIHTAGHRDACQRAHLLHGW